MQEWHAHIMNGYDKYLKENTIFKNYEQLHKSSHIEILLQ